MALVNTTRDPAQINNSAVDWYKSETTLAQNDWIIVPGSGAKKDVAIMMDTNTTLKIWGLMYQPDEYGELPQTTPIVINTIYKLSESAGYQDIKIENTGATPTTVYVAPSKYE